jgi:hypothetical protein
MTLSQTVLDEAEDLARALRDVGREEREVIAAGRLDDLEAFGARRGALLARLAAILPPGQLAPGPVRTLLEEAQEEARQSLAMLCALREELYARTP